jgi:hypothetical protein
MAGTGTQLPSKGKRLWTMLRCNIIGGRVLVIGARTGFALALNRPIYGLRVGACGDGNDEK